MARQAAELGWIAGICGLPSEGAGLLSEGMAGLRGSTKGLAVFGYDAPPLNHCSRPWPLGHSLGDRFSVQQHDVAAAACSQTVVLKAQRFGAPSRDDIECQFQFVVAPQVIAQSNEHGSFQHIGVAVRAPSVTDAV